MPRTQTLLILSCAVGALLSSACALPHGSMARPVQPAGEGAVMLAAGAMVPFAVAGGASGDGDSDFGAFSADNAIVIPAGSFDYALGDRHYIGVDVSVWHQAFAVDTDFDAFALFINPRWEYAVNENFSLTVDGNLAYLGAEDSGSPFLSPTFGVRAYIPTGFGGAVISQQVGTAFITLTLPGSLAYDVPIPVGEEAVLHIFPEVRWDPTLFFVGDASGFIAFFSGGLSFMLEI